MRHATCTLQIFIDGAWRDAADLDLIGDEALGMAAPTYLAYRPDYAYAYFGRADAAAISVSAPVDFRDYQTPAWPACVIDLLPQGYGRVEMLRQLGFPARAERQADWRLLIAGAGNPIGNIRIKAAHDWVRERSQAPSRGFTIDEVAARADDFNEYLAQHGLFLAGSSGIQGEWPKILLTLAKDGLYYLDHCLADGDAVRHFIVKFGRGQDRDLADILRLEAPYMALAKHLGLRVFAPLTLHGRALFIPRFDRAVHDDRVTRFGQESLAALCGVVGFEAYLTHNTICRRLADVVTDPAREILEYLKRDIANIVLGNKDNHARNTAVQRREDGGITLTPLFDFAPMWLHPDGIARRIRWDHDDGGLPNWASILQQAGDASGVDPAYLRAGVRAMLAPLQSLAAYAQDLGIEQRYIERHQATIDKTCTQLEQLHG